MLVETDLIVLRAIRFSDTSSIVQTYSDRYGSLSFKVSRSTRRMMASGLRAFFVPLSVLAVTFDYHQGREIQLPKEVSVIGIIGSASVDPVINAEVLFTSELLSSLLRSQGVDRGLFAFLKSEVLSLEGMETSRAASFHLRLMAGMCYHLGIIPECDGYRVGYVLDIRDGQFRTPMARHELEMCTATEQLVRLFTVPKTENIPMNRVDRNRLMYLLLDYISYHFPEVANLKSPTVLRDLFD